MEIEKFLATLKDRKKRRTLTDGILEEYAEKALDRYYLKSKPEELDTLTARRDELRKRLMEYQVEQARAEAVALELFGRLDGRKECVMICRYLLGMKWEDIAARLCFVSEHTIRLHRQAIADLSGEDIPFQKS